MDFNILTQHYMEIVVIACLIIGYCVKHTPMLQWLDNHLIPGLLAIIGAILGCIANRGVSLENIVYGAFSGLASVGFHQIFKQWIEGRDSDE